MIQLSYNIQTLAAVTCISESQLKQAIYRGDLVASKNGVAWLILAEDADAYLKSLPKPKMRKASESSEVLHATA